jgi:hypothetical protein
VWRIEYQKYGIPHAQIFFWTNLDPQNVNAIESVINVRYPKGSRDHGFPSLIDSDQKHHHSPMSTSDISDTVPPEKAKPFSQSSKNEESSLIISIRSNPSPSKTLLHFGPLSILRLFILSLLSFTHFSSSPFLLFLKSPLFLLSHFSFPMISRPMFLLTLKSPLCVLPIMIPITSFRPCLPSC